RQGVVVANDQARVVSLQEHVRRALDRDRHRHAAGLAHERGVERVLDRNRDAFGRGGAGARGRQGSNTGRGEQRKLAHVSSFSRKVAAPFWPGGNKATTRPSDRKPVKTLDFSTTLPHDQSVPYVG